MASQPPSNDEINVEDRSQTQNQVEQLEPQQPQHPQQTSTQMPRTPPSHSQTSNQSNRLSPGTTESPVLPIRPPATVSFPNFRDTSAATIGMPGRLEPDISFPAYNPPDVRMSGHSTLRVHNMEHTNGRRRDNDLWRPTLVPSEDWMYPPVHERLENTLKHAEEERDKSRLRARTARWSITLVAGAQVLLGALITGLSSLRLDGQSSASTTTALGILSTLSGSYLAHVRATAEPEKSIIRMHKLDTFIRHLDAFILDHGHDTTNKYKLDIDKYRHELELILAEASPLNTSRRLTSSMVEDKTKLATKESPQAV